EAVGLRWSQIDLDAGVIHIARVKGSQDSTHTMDRDELRDLRRLRQQVCGLYVFETERGGPLSVDALECSVCEAGKLMMPYCFFSGSVPTFSVFTTSARSASACLSSWVSAC